MIIFALNTMRTFTLFCTLLIISSCNNKLSQIDKLKIKVINLEQNYQTYNSLQWVSIASEVQIVENDIKNNKNDYSSNEKNLFLNIKMKYIQILKEKEENEYNNLLLEWSEIIKNAEKQN
jgi:hypothetical protein